MKKKRVFIADDHPLLRGGLIQVINFESDMEVCGEAGKAEEALRLIKDSKPDIAIIDLCFKKDTGSEGLDLIKDLKARFPKMPILVLSMKDEFLYAERTLRAGAMGYIMKDKASENIVAAIRNVFNGEIFISDEISKRILHKFANGTKYPNCSLVDCLSDQELNVFNLIGQGFSTKEIEKNMHISVSTIETYRSRIKEKLGLKDNGELLKHAIQWFHNSGGK